MRSPPNGGERAGILGRAAPARDPQLRGFSTERSDREHAKLPRHDSRRLQKRTYLRLSPCTSAFIRHRKLPIRREIIQLPFCKISIIVLSAAIGVRDMGAERASGLFCQAEVEE